MPPDKPVNFFRQYASSEYGRAETDVRAGLVILTFDRHEPYEAVNFDITVTGYDASGFIVFRERAWGQVAYPIYSRPFKWTAPAGLAALQITNFETEGWN